MTSRVVPSRVGWFELFYDLVIVASFAHTGHLIVGDLNGDLLTFSTGVWLVSTFVVTFTLWFSTTAAVNIAPGDVPLRKLVIFAQMYCVTVANLALSRSDSLTDDWGFAGLAAAFATVAVIYLITGRQRPELRPVTAPWIAGSAAAAGLLAIGVVIPDDWQTTQLAVYAAGIVVSIVPIVAVGIPRMCRMDLVVPEHLSERVGQLVIIVIGEFFLSLVLALSGFESVPGPIFFGLTFLVAGSLWAIYFASVFPMGIPRAPARLDLWILGVMIFLVGVSYLSETLAAYSTVEWSRQGGPHGFIPLAAVYVLVGVLVLGWAGGQSRDRDFALVHLGALGILAVMWIVLVMAGSPANLLLVGSAALVIGDGMACVFLQRRRALVA
ncbi:MAG: low temperature requirement protein A [Actinobacteria bacterium]|nr:low temperature requirement protein A [Actinomycetota bacterium]